LSPPPKDMFDRDANDEIAHNTEEVDHVKRFLLGR
jgi:hypothetical protein